MITATAEELKDSDLAELAAQKISFGEALMRTIEEFKNIEGSQKLCRKINQELKFLKKAIHTFFVLYKKLDVF